MHGQRAASHTARAEADANFAFRLALPAPSKFDRRLSLRLHEIGQHRAHPPRLDEAIGDVIDLHRGRQHAATQTGHLLDGEETRGIRIIIVANLQILTQGAIDIVGPLHMTGGAHAHLDRMPPRGLETKLGIEARHPRHVSRGDGGCRREVPQRRLGQIVRLLLNRTQQRHQMVGLPADGLDQGIYIGQRDFCGIAHGFSPKQ